MSPVVEIGKLLHFDMALVRAPRLFRKTEHLRHLIHMARSLTNCTVGWCSSLSIEDQIPNFTRREHLPDCVNRTLDLISEWLLPDLAPLVMQYIPWQTRFDPNGEFRRHSAHQSSICTCDVTLPGYGIFDNRSQDLRYADVIVSAIPEFQCGQDTCNCCPLSVTLSILPTDPSRWPATLAWPTFTMHTLEKATTWSVSVAPLFRVFGEKDCTVFTIIAPTDAPRFGLREIVDMCHDTQLGREIAAKRTQSMIQCLAPHVACTESSMGGMECSDIAYYWRWDAEFVHLLHLERRRTGRAMPYRQVTAELGPPPPDTSERLPALVKVGIYTRDPGDPNLIYLQKNPTHLLRDNWEEIVWPWNASGSMVASSPEADTTQTNAFTLIGTE